MYNTLQKLWGIVKDFKHLYGSGSKLAAIKWLFHNTRNLFYNRIEWIVFTRNLKDAIPSYQLKMPVNYQVTSLDELKLIEAKVLPSEFEYFRKRLLNGRICVLALYQRQVVAYAWMTSEVDFLVDNIVMRLKDGDAYIDDIYTLPEYRGQDIGKALNAYMLNMLREKGFQRAVAIVEINNTPSIKMHNSNGWQAIDLMSFHRFLSFRKYHYHENSFG